MAFSGGDGSVGNPYQITSIADLQAVASYLSSNFILMNDIDLLGAAWTGIGTKVTPFTGTFNGNNKIISNYSLQCSSGDVKGLFNVVNRSVLSSVCIYDLNVNSVQLNPTSASTAGDMGALIGIMYGSTCKVSGCSSSNVTQINNMTGIPSETTGGVGGLIGNIFGGSELTDCFSSNITLTHAPHVGGLVGFVEASMISSCGVISAELGNSNTSGIAGGFLGSAYGQTLISKCYTFANIDSLAARTGGFVGITAALAVDVTLKPTIQNCFSRGDVQSARLVGGFVGYSDTFGTGDTTITNCYSSGNVTCLSPSSFDNGGFLGGVYSASRLIITSCYYDSTVSGYTDDTYATHKTTAEMKAEETFIDWDFVDIWRITEGVTYPDFEDRPPPGPGPTPKMLIRWMNNNSGIWSYAREISLGDKGDTNLVATIKRLGAYKTRQYEFVISSDVPVVITAIEEEIQGEDRLKQ